MRIAAVTGSALAAARRIGAFDGRTRTVAFFAAAALFTRAFFFA
jgi:hypothetical protein